MWQVYLLVKYDMKAKFVCVCVCVCLSLSLSLSLSLCVCVCVCRCRWRNWYWYIYHALADTISLKQLDQPFGKWRQWFGFWGILSQYLTSTYTVSTCLRKELQGQKLTSTYLPGRLICEYIQYAKNKLLNGQICNQNIFSISWKTKTATMIY